MMVKDAILLESSELETRIVGRDSGLPSREQTPSEFATNVVFASSW
jgi:hypothetical protein